ncbi:phosphotransferase [Bacillus sp. FJAT-50079]|uniref:phosphotransferase n=1 Tax=Bacillus sp. FJAT-50079 TaxID=2833577 RepID=UPI001BC90459|nr:phosphotransferase [Bacillus sp. FJAT-50079]MBS4208975.1 phosphotransferase [Bacillus sp. FJAT-50079]
MNKQMKRRRGGFSSRLLLFIRKEVKLPVTRINKLKQGVWLLSGGTNMWIAKEFPTLSRLELQMAFTAELRDGGFDQSYLFYPYPLLIEERIIGLIQYIERDDTNMFHYRSRQNMNETLLLLEKFHLTTGSFVSAFQNKIQRFDQIAKWENRLTDFQQSIRENEKVFYSPTLKNIAKIGEWALKRMKADADFFQREPYCIIHGDVAYHNFIRGKDGKLYVIDFDLIRIAPAMIDWLQFCNRILPALRWRPEELLSFPQLRPFVENETFLAALVYPTDIFREWNFFVRHLNERNARLSFERTFKDHYRERMQFYQTTMEKLKNI